MNRQLLVAMVLTGTVLGAVPSFAEQKAAAPTAVQPAAAKDEIDLGLTPEQREKVKALKDSFQAELQAIANASRVKRNELKMALDQDKLDRKAIDKLVAEIGDLDARRLTAQVDQVFKMREVLTPEQFRKIQEYKEKRKKDVAPKSSDKKTKIKPKK
ncbi:MAG: Spy/CpxP family protein refolding chaperone [Candidatus Omnitrophica bacterium]|nr:Spy/CpxP family protein refolding chaperone [Candidatus Omnitrophota bacterium]